MLSVGFKKVSTEKKCQYEKRCPPKKVSQEALLLSADDQPSYGGNTTDKAWRCVGFWKTSALAAYAN